MILTDMLGVQIDVPSLSMTDSDLAFLVKHIRHTGYGLGYEGIETGLFKKYLVSGDSVIEIGGGIGLTSTYIDKLIKGRHLVYEANDSKEVYECLLNTKLINKAKYDIEFLCVTPTNKQGYTYNFSGSFFASRLVSGRSGNGDKKSIEFSKIPDGYNVLVMDAEGLEYLLSDVDHSSIKKYDKVFMEFHHKYFPEYKKEDTDRFIDVMKSNSFDVIEEIENHVFFRKKII